MWEFFLYKASRNSKLVLREHGREITTVAFLHLTSRHFTFLITTNTDKFRTASLWLLI